MTILRKKIFFFQDISFGLKRRVSDEWSGMRVRDH